MDNDELACTVRQAVLGFMNQYPPIQQQVLRQALLTELESLHHQLLQLQAGETTSEIKHAFWGMSSYLDLHETFALTSLTTVSELNAQVSLLLAVVRELCHGQ